MFRRTASADKLILPPFPSCVDSLPFVLAGCFVENVLFAVDGEDAVLESALPIAKSVKEKGHMTEMDFFK